MSNRISTRENELGVLLIDRAGKQFKLTTADMRLLACPDNLLALQREVKLEVGWARPRPYRCAWEQLSRCCMLG